jgi:peptide/nickel transport system permease protein
MNLDELWTSLSSAFPGLVAKLLAAVPGALIVLLAAFALNLAVRRALLLLAHRTSLTAQEISPLQNIVSWLIRIVASIAVLGVFGFQLGGLIGGALVTETVFAWPGVGLIVVDAINARDYPVVQAAVLVTAMFILLLNLLVDLLYSWLDPRIRY